MRDAPVAARPSPDAELAHDLAERAAELVRRGWCQGTSARDRRGAPVVPWDADAAAWSLMGALAKAWHDRLEDERPLALAAFRRVGLAVSDGATVGPQTWNDDPRRTSGEVVAALERAASELRRDGA